MCECDCSGAMGQRNASCMYDYDMLTYIYNLYSNIVGLDLTGVCYCLAQMLLKK